MTLEKLPNSFAKAGIAKLNSHKHVDWTAVKLEEYIEYDLETTPLYLKTDSVLGSNERLRLSFYTDQKVKAGGLNIYFSSTPRYFIHHCLSQTYFPTSLPTETEKVWKITLTRVSGIRLVIHINDVEVLNMVISNSTCRTYDFWNTYWSRIVKKIYFIGDDTASEFYSKFNHRSPPIEGEPNKFIASTLYALIIKDVYSQFFPIKFHLIKQLHCVSQILKI